MQDTQVAATPKEHANHLSGTIAVLTDTALDEQRDTTSDGSIVAQNNVSAKFTPVNKEQEYAEQAFERMTANEPTVPQKDESNATTTSNTTHVSTDMADVEKVAMLVIRGDYGNGERRKVMLAERYTAIQNRVNEIYQEKEGR